MIPVPSGEKSCTELIVFLLDLFFSLVDLLVNLDRCPAECVSRVPAILVDGDGVLFDVAKVKGEMLDKITKAEVMCRFSGICTIDPR